MFGVRYAVSVLVNMSDLKLFNPYRTLFGKRTKMKQLPACTKHNCSFPRNNQKRHEKKCVYVSV